MVTTEGIVDFSAIRKVIDQYDHAIIVPIPDVPDWDAITRFMIERNITMFIPKFVSIPYDMVTVEYLAMAIKGEILSIKGVIDVSFKLFETPTQGAIIEGGGRS